MSVRRAVLILESPAQIDVARRRLGGSFGGCQILATTPSVIHALGRLGVPYRIPEQYGSHEEVNRELRENFVRVRGWCREVDRLFTERNAVIRSRGLRAASYHYLQIVRLVNPVWIKMYHLLRLIDQERPDEIVYFTAGRNNLGRPYHFSEDDWLYASLVAVVAKAKGVELLPINFDRPTRPSTSLGARFRSASSVILRGGRKLRRLTIAAAVRRSGHKVPESSQRTIWIMHREFDVGLLIEEFKRWNWRILYWPITNDVDDMPVCRPVWLSGSAVDRHDGLDLPDDPNWRKRWVAECQRTWDALSEDPAIRSLFRFEGVDTSQVLVPRVGRCFTDSLPRVLRYHAFAEALFARHRPDAILSPWATVPALLGVFDLARRAGVPTFVYQHGGSAGFIADKANFEDRSEGDYFITHGEGVSQYMEMTPPLGHARSARPLTVGSAELDALMARARASVAVPPSNGGRSRPSRVLCIGWGYFVNSRYFPSYPATSYFLFERRKLELLGTFPHVEVLLKPYPGSGGAALLRQIIRERGWRHITVLTEGRVCDWLPHADLLVLDYTGTPLVEAVATAKPVILYLDERFQRLTPEAEKALGKRATFVRTPEEFLAVLRERLASGDFGELSDPDDEFLRLYATHLNDGNSLPRAYQAIVTKVEKWAPTRVRA